MNKIIEVINKNHRYGNVIFKKGLPKLVFTKKAVLNMVFTVIMTALMGFLLMRFLHNEIQGDVTIFGLWNEIINKIVKDVLSFIKVKFVLVIIMAMVILALGMPVVLKNISDNNKVRELCIFITFLIISLGTLTTVVFFYDSVLELSNNGINNFENFGLFAYTTVILSLWKIFSKLQTNIMKIYIGEMKIETERLVGELTSTSNELLEAQSEIKQLKKEAIIQAQRIKRKRKNKKK